MDEHTAELRAAKRRPADGWPMERKNSTHIPSYPLVPLSSNALVSAIAQLSPVGFS